MDCFAAAYRLAFFLHGDRRIARRIALSAIARMESAAACQQKRFYYRPKERRYKLAVKAPQLLLRLVCLDSEAFETRRALAGAATEDDLLLWLIKHLVLLTAHRSAFYAVAAVSRILYRYSTRDAIMIYDLVSQDPDCRRQDDAFRAAKKALFDPVIGRFGPWVDVERGARGEKHLISRNPTPRQRRLVHSCLERLTPLVDEWAPPNELNLSEEIEELRRVPGNDPDDEQEIELRRIHTVLHPRGFASLTAALGLPSPEDRLVVPVFRVPQGAPAQGDDAGAGCTTWSVPHHATDIVSFVTT